MCCFSGPVHVEGTQIFARTDGNGWQGIVYEMKYTARAPRTREPGRVFFPTVHVHDGTVPKKAHFDHMLYAQTESLPLGWTPSDGPAREFVDVERAQRLVRSTAYVHRMSIHGTQANQDTWLDA